MISRNFCSPAFIALLLAAGQALAHPSVVASTPNDGEAVLTAPRNMRIVFNEPIESHFTSVKVVDSSGKVFGPGQTRTDSSDPKAIVVDLPALASGAYKVQWSAAGRDGHRIKGELTFSVK